MFRCYVQLELCDSVCFHVCHWLVVVGLVCSRAMVPLLIFCVCIIVVSCGVHALFDLLCSIFSFVVSCVNGDNVQFVMFAFVVLSTSMQTQTIHKYIHYIKYSKSRNVYTNNTNENK